MPSLIPTDSLWRDTTYRRLWSSILVSSFSNQIGNLALALTAAVALKATPTQISMLGAAGVVPFVLFLLPAGVWLERVKKLPVYLGGEIMVAFMLLCIPVAWAFDKLAVELLYVAAVVAGSVAVFSGTAGQIVLTQIVRREQLVEAHAKNRVASSLAEVIGPGAAGVLIKLLGPPLTILVNCALMLSSAAILRRINVKEVLVVTPNARFWPQLKEGLRYVAADKLLLSMALSVGAWQVFQTCAMVTQVLFATRELKLNEMEFGLCLTVASLGSITAGSYGHSLASRFGPGPTLILGMAISGAGWLQLAWAASGSFGVASYVLMMVCFSTSLVLIFSNMLALRQAATPAPMLARMTSTMRWLTMFPALPGSLLGGVLAEHGGLRFPIAAGGIGALLLALYLWYFSVIRSATALAVAPDADTPSRPGAEGGPI